MSIFDQKLEEPQAPAAPKFNFEDFIAIYDKYTKGFEWLQNRIAEGKAKHQDRLDFWRLENRMDHIWSTFSDTDKGLIVEIMVKRGMLTERLQEILKQFNGTYVLKQGDDNAKIF